MESKLQRKGPKEKGEKEKVASGGRNKVETLVAKSVSAI